MWQWQPEHPLWMPKGSGQLLISLLVLFGEFILIMTGKIDPLSAAAKDPIAIVLGAYVVRKVVDKVAP